MCARRVARLVCCKVLPRNRKQNSCNSCQDLNSRHRRFYLRGISGMLKSAADKPSDYLSTNQRHVGFDDPAHSYFAAGQALIAFCHCQASDMPWWLSRGPAYPPARSRTGPSKLWTVNRVTAAFFTLRVPLDERNCVPAWVVLFLDQMM